MTVGVVKSQGTELFLIDTLTVPLTPAIVKFACPTGISGLGGAADQIEDTCLDTVGDKTYQRGLGNPAQLSVPFNFIPRNISHQLLFNMQADGRVFRWMIALSEGTTDPTLSAGAFVNPTGRSVIQFDAYVADVNLDIATNDLVRGTMTLQRSGAIAATWYTPV